MSPDDSCHSNYHMFYMLIISARRVLVGGGILTYSGICLPKDNSEVMAHISDTEY